MSDQNKNPQQPLGSSNMLLYMLAFFLIILVFNSSLGVVLANATDKTLGPLIGFNHEYPLMTMLITLAITVGISTVIRHYFTDWIEMAKSQKIVSEFQKMKTEAMRKNNTAKLKKLEEMQPEVTAFQQQQMSKTLSSSIIPMFLAIIFIRWLWSFMENISYPVITMPWTAEWNMLRYTLKGVCCFGGKGFPYWLAIYTLISLPISQALMRGLKFIEFERIIKERKLRE